MNRRWTRGRIIGLAALAVASLATVGSALGQTKGEDSAARLRKVEDRQAIEQLLMGDYPRALDATDWKAYAALFTKDGTLIMNGGKTKETGPAAIQKFFATAPFAQPPAAPATPSPCPLVPGVHRFMHVVTNLTLQIDGDTATDQAYWETIGTTDCKSVVEGAGHYEDTLKREDGHWRFYSREIFDDLPPRAAAAPAAAAPAAPKP
jgi:3-phenylpropionate/cinnamic acid dioxygenase small subunit